ncbi:PBECR2 nuclease fold domain-containing protein [Clostridium paraputrificum]|uniref:PBECR3 domain-containing polyvalent protein n=1 Tax=Clostridium TaxID=1485 RepID=UPI003D34BF14
MKGYYKAYRKVGQINTSVAERLGFEFDGYVYASPGVINHIKKHHGKQLTKKVKENLLKVIEDIIEYPDYIGIDRRRGKLGAIEFVKKIDNMLLLGLEVDLEEEYIYVATLYPITKSKINSRLFNGRLIIYEEKINRK